MLRVQVMSSDLTFSQSKRATNVSTFSDTFYDTYKSGMETVILWVVLVWRWCEWAWRGWGRGRERENGRGYELDILAEGKGRGQCRME